MNEDILAQRLREEAAAFPYPPTPDIAGHVLAQQPRRASSLRPANYGRRLAFAAVVIVLLLLSLLASPPVRAAVLRALRIGAAQIFIDEAQPLPAPDATSFTNPGTAVSVDEAQAQFPEPLLRPAGLGEADWVYMKDAFGRDPVVTMIWLANEMEERPQITLSQLAIPSFVQKWVGGEQVRHLQINNQDAIWLEGSHLLRLEDPFFSTVVIEDNVLLWTNGKITYRLEGKLSLDEALMLAESLR